MSSKRFLQFGAMALLVLMPFHAFLVTWAGSVLGHRAVWQAWKEVLLVLMGFAAVFQLTRNRQSIHILWRPVNLAAIGFAIVGLLVSAFGNGISSGHFLLGAKIDLEFLFAFIVVQFVATIELESIALKVVAITSSIVAIIALLQVYLLPADFLKHFGYGPTTIEPVRYVDPALSAIRVLSTLGGPNQLGAFMILPVCLFVFLLVRKRQWWAIVPFVLTTLALIHSYSRSALLGVLVAIVITVFTGLSWRWLLGAGLALTVLGAVVFGISRTALSTNTTLTYYVLHGKVQYGRIRGSDDGRLQSLQAGLTKAKAHPLGEGLGTAGPATLGSADAAVTEDYYLQLAIETGVLGLILFMATQAFLVLDLWQLIPESDLAAPLIGTLAGIAVVNLFLHSWADSSTALVFWTSAGIVVGNRRDIRHV